jgi:hypothetical protein
MSEPTPETRSGGCLCGAVRYTTSWPPIAVATCQCVNCQKQAGSSISVLVLVPIAGLEMTGETKTYEDHGESGGKVYRKFCPNCGSPVISDIPGMEAQGIRVLKAGTLDDRTGLNPQMHYWTDSAQDWMILPEGGVKLATQ